MEYFGYDIERVADQLAGERRDAWYAYKGGREFYVDEASGVRRVSWPTLDALKDAIREADGDDYDPEWLELECQ